MRTADHILTDLFADLAGLSADFLCDVGALGLEPIIAASDVASLYPALKMKGRGVVAYRPEQRPGGSPPSLSIRPAASKGNIMSTCDHLRWVYPPPEPNYWTGEMEDQAPYQQRTTEDIDTGRFRCTQCMLVMYYTGLWREVYCKP